MAFLTHLHSGVRILKDDGAELVEQQIEKKVQNKHVEIEILLSAFFIKTLSIFLLCKL